MALLGTLLVSILVASGRMRKQSHAADLRVEACRMADDLLATWWQDRKNFPRSGSGDVPERPGWRWRTRVVESREAWAVYGEVVALEILSEAQPGAAPMARVEILLPVEREDEAGGPHTD